MQPDSSSSLLKAVHDIKKSLNNLLVEGELENTKLPPLTHRRAFSIHDQQSMNQQNEQLSSARQSDIQNDSLGGFQFRLQLERPNFHHIQQSYKKRTSVGLQFRREKPAYQEIIQNVEKIYQINQFEDAKKAIGNQESLSIKHRSGHQGSSKYSKKSLQQQTQQSISRIKVPMLKLNQKMQSEKYNINSSARETLSLKNKSHSSRSALASNGSKSIQSLQPVVVTLSSQRSRSAFRNENNVNNKATTSLRETNEQQQQLFMRKDSLEERYDENNNNGIAEKRATLSSRNGKSIKSLKELWGGTIPTAAVPKDQRPIEVFFFKKELKSSLKSHHYRSKSTPKPFSLENKVVTIVSNEIDDKEQQPQQFLKEKEDVKRNNRINNKQFQQSQQYLQPEINKSQKKGAVEQPISNKNQQAVASIEDIDFEGPLQNPFKRRSSRVSSMQHTAKLDYFDTKVTQHSSHQRSTLNHLSEFEGVSKSSRRGSAPHISPFLIKPKISSRDSRENTIMAEIKLKDSLMSDIKQYRSRSSEGRARKLLEQQNAENEKGFNSDVNISLSRISEDEILEKYPRDEDNTGRHDDSTNQILSPLQQQGYKQSSQQELISIKQKISQQNQPQHHYHHKVSIDSLASGQNQYARKSSQLSNGHYAVHSARNRRDSLDDPSACLEFSQAIRDSVSTYKLLNSKQQRNDRYFQGVIESLKIREKISRVKSELNKMNRRREREKKGIKQVTLTTPTKEQYVKKATFQEYQD